jgi:hypothetical protein
LGTSWDVDGDSVHDGAECAYGTDPTSAASKPNAATCRDGAAAGTDTDQDGLLDNWETCKWRTSKAVVDSDGDGLGDCIEVMDTNGNGSMTNADAALVTQVAFNLISGDLASMDINGNGFITYADSIFIAQAVFNAASFATTPCL